MYEFQQTAGNRPVPRTSRAWRRIPPAPAAAVCLLLVTFAAAPAGSQAVLAPYVATPPDVVDRMLSLAAVGPRDVVYDLGCGDGRVVIAAAAKFGARGVGLDID